MTMLPSSRTATSPRCCNSSPETTVRIGRPKPQWEFPRLCRGGSKSLTYPAVDTVGPSTRLRIVSRQSTRKGVPSMDDYESLSHSKWECKYHVVFIPKYRRSNCVRLIDSTSVQLSSLSGNWATFSTGVCGAKAHIVYDPDADQPLHLMVTPANVNDITAAKEMPIEAYATYVFDLGYYYFGWWARLDREHCRIVTRLKANTPFKVVEERPVAPGSGVLSDRTGYLPARMAAS